MGVTTQYLMKKTRRRNKMVKCDVKDCKNRAKYNIQSMWHLYEIHYSENGARYEELKEWDAEDSNHYCTLHANEELGLGLQDDEITDELEE
jgi:hypothetical protein